MEDLDAVAVKKRSVMGIITLTMRQFILKLISLAAAIVIATHLSPAEFGTYIIIITIQQIISFFTDFGLGAALIQKKGELEQKEITTVFTIQLLVTSIIFVFMLLMRNNVNGIIGLFTRSTVSSDGIWLLMSLGFTLFLSSFKLIPSILLERNIQFHKLVIPQIAESLVFNILLITLMLQHFGLWSYTWAFAISSVISLPIYYGISPWKIQMGISSSSLHHLRFGSQFQAKNILANFKDKFLKLFLGATLGNTKIGYIGFAESWSFFAYNFIVDSVTKVTFSTYSRLQDQKNHMQQTIEKSLFFVSAIMFPVNIGLIITMPYVISFTPQWQKWQPAVMSLAFLTMNATVSSLSGVLINVLDANGKVKTTLRLMVLWTILTWVLTIALIRVFDYNGVAIASFLVTLTIGYTVYLVKKIVAFNFLGSIYKSGIATLGMSVSMYSYSQYFVKDWLTLIVGIIISGTLYMVLLYLLAGKEIIFDIKGIIVKR